MIGVSAAMANIRDIGVVDGRFFTDQEERSRAYVAVIGDTVRTTLFPGDVSPLGGIIRIEGIEFTVIGVQERLGSAFGRDQDARTGLSARLARHSFRNAASFGRADLCPSSAGLCALFDAHPDAQPLLYPMQPR